MKLKFILFILLFVGLTYNSEAQTHDVGGATFSQTLKIGNNSLTYNGAGVRTKFFMSLYSAAVYLPSISTDAQKIIDSDENSAVKMVILSGLVTRDKFLTTVRDGFATATQGEAKSEEIRKLESLFDEVEFKKMDEVILYHKEGGGITVYFNKKNLGEVGGLNFKKALYSIWLGNKPASTKLKDQMLGKR